MANAQLGGRITQQNFESARAGIHFMKQGVDATTEIVESAMYEILALADDGRMSGPAAESFNEVARAWHTAMKKEIDRLNHFAEKGEEIVDRQEKAELERARKELGEPGWNGPGSQKGYVPDADASVQ
ncbi:hypothetical protein [Streptomyces sp. NPDC056632]|uniref:hypothetical protein n=1 Tax=Streptomyces sp. NPDC056632 TaxID=3345884 RepID=UPI0036C08EFA